MHRICTIIALNYLPQAMALLESTRRVYPEIEFYVLIIDTDSRDCEFLPSAKVLIPEDLIIPKQWLQEMCSYYDAMELATSLKPFLLDTLLEKGVSTVTFLDPDILLFDKLDEGMQSAEEYGIALTPHRLTPSDIYSKVILDLGFLQYGIFNLGYISVGQKSKLMLEWWGTRLRWYCTKFPGDPVFTDQKWMNFIPTLFEHKVLKHSGYNLAPWNIDERPLTMVNGKLLAGSKELVFIHFSQMSGALVKGQKTHHWKEALAHLETSQLTLETIEQITDGYTSTLTNFGLISSAEKRKSKLRNHRSYHAKRKLIRKIILGAESKKDDIQGHNRRDTLNPKSFWLSMRISLLLEKSSTINGFRDGLYLDLAKLKLKYLGKSR
jgi:hypothetical protein